MTLESRVTHVEVDLEDVKALLGSAARHAENATAIAEQNSIAIAGQRQNMQLANERMDRVDAQIEATRQNLDEHIANSEITHQQLTHNSQRLDEFIFQSQRLRNDHGDRLSRVEAALETLVSLSQSHERRLAGRESRFLEVEDRLNRIEANIEGLSGEVRSLTAAVDRLETILERHLSNHG